MGTLDVMLSRRREVALNRKAVRPVPLDLESDEGRRRVLETARKVMHTYAPVLAALARR